MPPHQIDFTMPVVMIKPLVILLMLSHIAVAQRLDTTGQKPLRGLKGATVLTRIQDGGILRNLVSETDLAILCTAELRRAGFLVTETNQVNAQPPLLIIEVIPFRRGEIILYSIEVRLNELARLLRKEALRDAPDLVSSWGSSTTDAVPIRESRTRILDNARRGIELFLQDWKAANPR